jgi:hypothetical protein
MTTRKTATKKTAAKKAASPRSGNPAKRAASSGPSTVEQWKSTTGVEDITVPSGNVAKVRRVGPEAFMGSGIVPDALSPMIDEAIKQKKGLPPAKVAEKLKDDPESLPQMLEMMNRIVCYAVLRPPVEMTPGCERAFEKRENGEPVMEVCDKQPADIIHGTGAGKHKFREAERDPDLLYVDEVDIEDRIFIMNYAVGGTRDLARFRREHRQSVAGLASSTDVQE